MAVRPARTPSPTLHRGLAYAVLPFLLVSVAAPANAASAATAVPVLEPSTVATPANASPQLTAAQAQISAAARAYDAARASVTHASQQAERLAVAAELAEVRATELRDEVTHEKGGTVLQALAGLVADAESDLDRAAQAADDAAHARNLATMAATALTDAITATEQARVDWEVAQVEAKRIESQWTARQAADSAIRRSTFRPGYDVDDKAQDVRNRKALRAWHSYLDDLADLGVVPPAAKRLNNPDRLPRSLERVRDIRGAVVTGVAEIDPADRPGVTVVPAETVRAVSEAFRRVGLSKVPGAISPSTYACGGFLANAWGPTGLTLPADSVNQWRELRTVPRHALQVGDAVVLGSKAKGLEQSGVYVGDRNVIVADTKTGTAGVQTLPRKRVFGVKRVPLPTTRTYAAPPAGACGGEKAPAPVLMLPPIDSPIDSPVGTPSVPGATGDSPFVLPVAAGSYTLSAIFGATGPYWSSGSHTGLDFAAPTGTPVVAMADGVVSTENPAWAGNLVRIDHGGGVESSYAHLSSMSVRPGQTVRRGDLVGAVGSTGNSTGPHLHLEVRLDGNAVDPAHVLDVPELPHTTYPNGEIPENEMCAATSDGLQLLSCDAAVSYRMMSAAYANAFGTSMCLTDSYRSRAGQEVLLGTKPGLAATPGTSVHGLGLAVDLCGGIERFGTSQHTWVVTNGPRFGWGHPSWAAEAGSRPEPWHFEYTA